MLDVSSATPLYRQLYEQLEKEIRLGTTPPGGKLKTETELSAQYGVSIITVRKAVGLLAENGLVEKRQGKGTFVAKHKMERNMKMLQSFSEMCRQIGNVPGAKLLENKLVVPAKSVTDGLLLPEGSQTVFISRLRTADGTPVVIEKNYFPLEYAFLLKETFNDTSLFRFLQERAKVEVHRSEKRIEICKATPAEAKLLGVKKGESMLYVKSITYDRAGRPIYVGRQVINGELFSLYTYTVQE